MTPPTDLALLLDLLCLGSVLPAGKQRETADQWRAVSGGAGLQQLLQYEGAELWLYRRLRALGIESAPALEEGLRLAAHRATIRGLRIDDEAVAVLTAFRDAGIPCVLIKGQARRAAAAIYPWADARTSSDVDLLLPADQVSRAWDLLIATGYTRAGDPSQSYAEHFHFPPVWSARGVAVELHTSTSPYVDAERAWRRATDLADQVTWSGFSVTVPSATELLWHGMAHAFLDGPAATRLRSLLVGAVILGSGRPIDWVCLQRRMASGEVREPETGYVVTPEVQLGWLATAATLGGTDLPVPADMSRALPIGTLLRWRRLVLGAAMGRAARERLLDEAARCELQLPIAPSPGHVAAWRRFRRTVATSAARACYRSWRAMAT